MERLEAADEALQASSMACPAASDGDAAGRKYMACECGRRMLVGGGEAEACFGLLRPVGSADMGRRSASFQRPRRAVCVAARSSAISSCRRM